MSKYSYQKRLVLLDAHAIIHRAYHALSTEWTNSAGVPTGALYGLTSMLLKIIQELKPDYMAACFDLPKPTIRHEAYADYKGTRAKTDEALVVQLKLARKVFEAFSIPMYDREGFEADDLLGTIAHECKQVEGLQVVIASGDMDMLQLVDDERVLVYTFARGMNDTILYNEQKVKERFGFGPELIPDYKGLRGDPSDNIKGVAGVGEKTATDLIVGFGSLEKLFAELKKKDGEKRFLEKGIKARIAGLLKEHEEDARFSKSLASIRLDAPIAFLLPKESWREQVHGEKVFIMCDEFGFRTLRTRARTVLDGNTARLQFDVAEESAESAEPIPPEQFAEAQIMLWLLASDFTNPNLDDILAYAKEQSFDAAYAILEQKLAETGHLKEVYDHIERPLVSVLARMKEHGVLIDRAALKELARRYHTELDSLSAKIFTSAGQEFNINSPKQLGEVLFEKMGLLAKGKKTATGQRSTKESELEKIREEHPIIDQILEYREVQKLLSTYIDSIPQLLDSDDRLHADFIQTGTTTGRFSSANPNLQNIPIRSERGRAIRRAFIAQKGFTLVAFDYSQIELRIAAILSQDEKLCAIFKSGRDVHQEVAAQVFGVPSEKVDREMRRRAKIINFGILYGMGVNALKSQLGSSIAEAHEFLENYFKTFKTLAEHLERTKGSARKLGYTETLFGRRREFPGLKSPLPYVRAQSERMAINAPIQGTQSDIIKLAMVRIDEYLKKETLDKDAYLLLQVHDELVYEVRDAKVAELAPVIKNLMETALPSGEQHGVPILAEGKLGENWDEMKAI